MMNRRRLLSVGVTGFAAAVSGCVFGDDDEEVTPTPTPTPEPQPVQVTSGSATLYDGLLFEELSIEVEVPDGGILIIRTRQIELLGDNPALVINDELDRALASHRRDYVELEPGTHEIQLLLTEGTIPDLTLELHHPDAIDPDDYQYPINTEIFPLDTIPTRLVESQAVEVFDNQSDWVRGVIRPDIPVALILHVHEYEGEFAMEFFGVLGEDDQIEGTAVAEPGTYVIDFDIAGEILFQIGSGNPDHIDRFEYSIEVIETERYRSIDELELVDLDAPETAIPQVAGMGGEEWNWSMTIENPTEYPSRFHTNVHRYHDERDRHWWVEDQISLTIPANDEITYESGDYNTHHVLTNRFLVEAFAEEFVVEPEITVFDPGQTIITESDWEITVDEIEKTGVNETSEGDEHYVSMQLTVTNLLDEDRDAISLSEFQLVGESTSHFEVRDDIDMEGWYPDELSIDAGETHEGVAITSYSVSSDLDDLGVQIGESVTPGVSYVWTPAEEFGPFYPEFQFWPGDHRLG